MNNINPMWFWIVAFILNDVLIAFTFWQLWRNNFFLHIVYCSKCGSSQMVSIAVDKLRECPECHVCERCGKLMRCETCGRELLVPSLVEDVAYCSGIGCKEKYDRTQKALAKGLNKRKSAEK